MKLVVAIVQNEDVGRLLDSLQKEGIMATKLSTSGGFLRSGNTTLLIGVEDDRVGEVIDIISQKCKTRKQIVSSPVTNNPSMGAYIPYPIEITIGGATIFVLNIERFEKV
ncbi:cyclic-di-AMP receptor [Caldicellulosiruptor naganoensis]|uniref:Cyclic-di-AMP receptor n=1 Tax=Caldicellulosiruptor naganoensis TaxID=29324 RepID=A0ABY7BJR1_9FIRM|nr:cyclic-di-AMP receptor [Caldicellulosiruptor naganoensis]WAM31276.1 cyclic-di-AMP receptor [Caldicellulosiruptor naganoensis]